MLRVCALYAAFVLFGLTAVAQQQGTNPAYKLIGGNNWVKAKNYYLLTLLEHDKAISQLLGQDTLLNKIAQAKLAGAKTSLAECKTGLCFPAKLKFTDEDINAVSGRLISLYKTGGPLDVLVKKHLLPSGAYNIYGNLPPAQLLAKAWQQDAAAVNYAISVYAEGSKPNYPLIDSISFDVHKRSYYTLMYDCTAEVLDVVKSNPLFFEPALQAALVYLEINERQNAGFYEPMASTANKLAVIKVPKIRWGNYPYSHILVPGAGPESPNTPLSGEGMLRCKMAARQYFAGKAPFVVVSGGSVHPFKTKYNEAAEMKKYMLNTLHIPESVLIIEPHARHTTTNLRNDARLIYRYGIPMDKPGLIITDKYQNDFITNMDKRCLKELQYVPYKLGKRLADSALEFYPLANSLQIDADEPLDPH